jgi:hypothetical protein
MDTWTVFSRKSSDVIVVHGGERKGVVTIAVGWRDRGSVRVTRRSVVISVPVVKVSPDSKNMIVMKNKILHF